MTLKVTFAVLTAIRRKT